MSAHRLTHARSSFAIADALASLRLTPSALAAFVLAVAASAQGTAPPAADESLYYAVDYLVPPDGARLEVGGLGFLPDGRLVASTRRGQVWIVDDPLAKDPKDARFHLFAEGLQEGLGLAVVDGAIIVLQRAELSRLVDEDQDGTCDRIDTLANDWGVSGHYHEFAFGLPRDSAGNFYISLNVSFGNPHWWHGRSTVPDRGWVMKIAPDGTTTPFASGVRSPCGLGTNCAGDLFLTDNQGDWVPACPIVHVQEGRFYGHPASLNWTDDYLRAHKTASDTTPPERERAKAAVWIPYDWSRSAGNLVCDSTGGKFGPFGENLFVAELTNGLVLRASLEKVRGEYQGAVFPFRQHVGSAVRLCFAPDGTLFTGFTDRGWGGQPPPDGIARIRWTGETPMEMQHVHLLQDGVEVTFTDAVAKDVTLSPADVHLVQYDYDYWWEYGSPVRHLTERACKSVAFSPDRKRATVKIDALEAGMVLRMKLSNVRAEDGRPLLHDEMAYTINELPEGPAKNVHVAKLVPPPTPRDKSTEGLVMLMRGDALDAWTHDDSWSVGDVGIDEADPTKLVTVPPPPPADEIPETPPDPPPVLSNLGHGGASDLVTRYEFGDFDMHVDFMLPKGGSGGVLLMDRYEVQLKDSSESKELTLEDCGGLDKSASGTFTGRAPMFRAFRRPGEWHGLDIRFRAPRFDANGKKTTNAKIERVMIDDTLLQEEVDVPEATREGNRGPEVARGPIRLRGKEGEVAYRSVYVRPRNVTDTRADWVRIFDGKSLDGWKISDGGQWKVEDGAIVGSGPRSHLFSPRADYKNLEFRARVKINRGGNSGMYFRVAFGPAWPAGYEAQVNSTHEDPVKTGSLYSFAVVKTRMVPHETWFTQRVVCKDEPAGTHVQIYVNDVLVTDYVDATKKHASGHVAFQQHHDGSVVMYKDVEVREL